MQERERVFRKQEKKEAGVKQRQCRDVQGFDQPLQALLTSGNQASSVGLFKFTKISEILIQSYSVS